MRLTNEEILTQFQSWSNHPSGNIQQVRYGDIPDCQYTQDYYNRYQQETDPHLLIICCAEAYIYSQHGAFDIYKTIAGDIYIHTETQQILHGSINVPYRNKPITIHLNLMYGLKALSLLSLRGIGKVKGFCNKNGIGSMTCHWFSPANHLNTEELDTDIIKSVLNNPMEDYGYGVQKFMQAARELYAEDPFNTITNKTFEL